jgi:hypothetical protein
MYVYMYSQRYTEIMIYAIPFDSDTLHAPINPPAMTLIGVATVPKYVHVYLFLFELHAYAYLTHTHSLSLSHIHTRTYTATISPRSLISPSRETIYACL